MTFLEQLLANPMFAGLGGATVLGWGLYMLRELPSTVWDFCKWRFTCEVTIFSEDAAYEKANEWLSRLDYAKRSRKLRLGSRWDEETQRDEDVLGPGLGKHLFWHKGRPIVLQRTLPDKGGIGGWKRFEDIHLSTLGSDPAALHGIVTEIQDARKSANATTTSVFLYRNRWRLACRKPKRKLETVVLPAEQKEWLLDDVKRFLDSRSWYQDRGVPWRRGYMLEGSPGCGKTSIVLAIAAELGRPIYALNLGSIANDDELIDAVCEVPEHGILLIEDIDAAQAGAKRESKPAESAEPAPTTAKEKQREISLSALLNVLDGAFSREGGVLFMTSNHPEKVDPALLRPGRSDCRLQIGPLGKHEAETMARRFLGDDLAARRFIDAIECPIPAAELQEKLVQERSKPALRGAA